MIKKPILKALTRKLAAYLSSQRHAEMEIRWLTQAIKTRATSPEYLTQLVTRAVEQRINEHKPLNYIIGDVPFLDLTLAVEPPILIPRPETEEIAAWAIDALETHKNEPLAILDLCTGSGCLALALAHAFPNSTVTGVDINPQAVALAQKNALLNKIENTTFLTSDLFTAIEGKQFNLIISNPPYIAHDEWETLEIGVKEWEDKRALVAPDEGLFFYEKIAANAASFLRPCALPFNLLFEIGHEQKKAVSDLLATHSFSKIFCHADLSLKNRWIAAKQ